MEPEKKTETAKKAEDSKPEPVKKTEVSKPTEVKNSEEKPKESSEKKSEGQNSGKKPEVAHKEAPKLSPSEATEKQQHAAKEAVALDILKDTVSPA